MEISAATWSTLSKLLDEALDLEPAARATWLEGLKVTQPSLAPSVLRLLEAHASSETADVLARLPTLTAATSAARLTSLAAGDHIGPYRLKRELGTGGMADVWLAERADGAFARDVALKLPMIHRLRRDLAVRFARERDILAKLEHPNIARLYDAGVTADGLPYLAMEYVDGRPITEYCDAQHLDISARLKLFSQVLAAVQYAHASLVIHRDIKPSNILVTAGGDVRLLDFGIAKLLADDDTAHETQLTQLSGRALTPDYASPEQIKGEPLTIATDVYSLGVVLFELLVGSRPYRLKVQSVAQLEQAIIDAEPQRPSSATTAESAARRSTTPSRLARALTGDLDTIVLKTLAKPPAQRYSTVAELAQDLSSHLTGLPVSAQPASWRYRARKFVLRNRLAVGAGATISTILIASTVVSLWQARVAREQTTVAEQQAKRAQAVQRFLLDLFNTNTDAQADPVKARQMTARELLDAGAARVQQLSDVPEVQEEVLATLTDMYRALGLAHKEAEIERQRVDLRRRIYGANDPRVAEALILQAQKLRTTEDQPLAASLLAQAQEILDKSPKAAPSVRAALLTELARDEMYTAVTRMRSHAGEAVKQLQLFDSGPEQRATALRLSALANTFLGYWASSIEIHQKALAELRKNELRPFNLALTLTVEMADAHALRGDVPTAERLFQEILAESTKRNGELHVDTIHVQSRLVNFLHATARREESRRLRVATLEKLERSESKNDTGLAPIVRRNAASVLYSEGQFGAAFKSTAANTEQARRLMPGSIALGSRLLNHGVLAAEMGRYDEAAALLQEAASTHRAAMGPDAHPVTESRFELALARLSILRGTAQEAVGPLQRLVAAPIPEGVVAPLDRMRAQVALAYAYVQTGQSAPAVALTRSVIDQLTSSPVREYYQTIEADASLQLGRALLLGGDLGGARPALERSLSLRTDNDHTTSPWIAEAQIALADCLIALGETAQARSLLKQAATIHSAHAELGEHYRKPLVDAQSRLGKTSVASIRGT